jgi:hypothetical protein
LNNKGDEYVKRKIKEIPVRKAGRFDTKRDGICLKSGGETLEIRKVISHPPVVSSLIETEVRRNYS